MSKKESTEVAVKQETALAESGIETSLSDWGDSAISSRDIVIPKILLMQGLSDLVADGKAKIGDFADSTTGDILGSIDKPVEFIPFHMTKVWIVSRRKKNESKFEFERYADAIDGSELPFEQMDGEDTIKNEYALQFYVLLKQDMSMPYVITFKSTSLRAGKVLSTQMYVRNRAAGLVPPAYSMFLGGKKEKNDKGTFAVMELKTGTKTMPEEIKECLNWFNVVKAGKTKVAAERAESNVPYADENVTF